VPFRTVYIHALVRDERGQKMSKSRGNIIDPLDLIDRYGCDAVRFTLVALAAPGRDIKLAERRVEGYRNFVTKLWNAARFAEMNGCALVDRFDPARCRLTVNRWIAAALSDCAVAVTTALDTYRFDEAANRLYQFVWGTFCDWYIEFTKPVLQADDPAARTETQATTAWVLGQIAHLLHPIMPFVTEEVWENLAGAEAGMLLTASWPDFPPGLTDPVASAEMEWVTDVISAIRGVRSELNVPPSARVPLILKDVGSMRATLGTQREQIESLARVEVREDSIPATPGVQVVVHGETFVLGLGGIIDFSQEKSRLSKEIGRVEGDLTKFEANLSNESFRARAKREVVEELEQRVEDIRRHRDRLRAAYDGLMAS